MMTVKLIGNTYAIELERMGDGLVKDDNLVIAAAAKQCYNKNFNYIEFYNNHINENKTKNQEFIKRIADSGHTSILEHASATFLITGVSRALTHQLVRHRIASYTQQSQRYVDMSELKYIVPPSIAACNDPAVISEYKWVMDKIEITYKYLVRELIKSGRTEQQAHEDARFVLPNAAETQIVMTMNYRELGDFLGKRMCKRAQWEIRQMATEIFNIMSKQSPGIFGKNAIYRGPKCKTLGYCNEGHSCGMMLTLDQLSGKQPTVKETEDVKRNSLWDRIIDTVLLRKYIFQR